MKLSHMKEYFSLQKRALKIEILILLLNSGAQLHKSFVVL